MIRSDFLQYDESKKDKAWFARIIDLLIVRKRWLVEPIRYNKNESFSNGTYDVSATEKKYDIFNNKKEDLGIDFQQLDLFGNMERSIISTLEKQGFEPKAKCTDPTARSKKERDIELLKAEEELKEIRTQFGKGLGLTKPLPLAKEEDFSSDIAPVKELGLDMTNPIDEGIYKNLLQRQIWEIAIELGIAHYMNQSDIKELFKMICRDLINQNAASLQCNINSFSGQPEIRYLFPNTVYTLLGWRPDRSDAIGKGYEILVSARDIVALLGSQVTQEELNQVLASVNTANNSNWAGIWMPGTMGTCPKDWCTYEAFLEMQGYLGYLEMKSQNADTYHHYMDDGNLFTNKLEAGFVLPDANYIDDFPEKDGDNFLEYKFYDVTYKGFYVPYTRLVFGFGKLPLATRFGSVNERTDFSIATYNQRGKSMNEQCQPFILHIFDLWCKLQDFINQGKASGWDYNLNTVQEIANLLIGTEGDKGNPIEAIKIMQGMVNGIYVPETVDGQQTGGDADPVKQRIRGIDPTAKDIVNMMNNELAQIERITGVNSILLAQAPPQADTGYRVSQLYLQQSINTIFYIQSATNTLLSNIGLNLCQKIQHIAVGEKSTPAYKSLVQAIGERNVKAIQQLGKEPPYTFSIFIEYGLTELQRAEIKAQTDLMLQSKAITASQAMQINGINNYKLAAALLAYYERRMMEEAIAAQGAAFEQQRILAAEKAQNDLALINAEGQFKVQVADTTGQWAYKVEELKVFGDQKKTETKELSKQITQDKKQENELEKITIEKSIESAMTE